MDTLLKVVIFGGGSGAVNIIRSFKEYSKIDLTVLVNAYDDGLSTGRLRQFIPGMLGPSDVRKNIITLIPETNASGRALQTLMEYRFPKDIDRETAYACLTAIVNRERTLPYPELADVYPYMNMRQINWIADYLKVFLQYEQQQMENGSAFDFADTSIGNLLFSGCYLSCERDFNRTTKAFQDRCEIFGRVLNITDGANQVLVGIKDTGTYLHDEAAIVVAQEDTSKLHEIFLLEDYLTDTEHAELQSLPTEGRIAFLKQRSVIPGPNPEVFEALAEADLIIYGPGTQHSSLFPSYLVKDIPATIAANQKAEKVFIGNITYDHDIPTATVQELIERFFFYMSAKGTHSHPKTSLVTRLFIQEPDSEQIREEENPKEYLPYNLNDLGIDSKAVTMADWESSVGRHSGDQIVAELFTLFRQLNEFKVRPYRFLISIIVPAFNEASTVRGVLQELIHLDVSPLGVGKEIIFVDGGSNDGTLEIALQERFLRCYKLEPGLQGCGEAMKLGISKAKGNVVVFFPADGEYTATDIIQVVEPIVHNQFNVVFGSRAIKCLNMDQVIKEVYGNRFLMFVISKYGGILLSTFSLLFFNRYLSDPLSSLKAFDIQLLRSFQLKSKGIDIEMEIIARIHQAKTYILEVPVAYKPRMKAKRKKSTIKGGLKAIFRLFGCKLFPMKFEA